MLVTSALMMLKYSRSGGVVRVGASAGNGVPGGSTPAREFFAVITAQVLTIDWLELHREGHRRAIFDKDGARWVQP